MSLLLAWTCGLPFGTFLLNMPLALMFMTLQSFKKANLLKCYVKLSEL
jgi:hypothetical protein